jgi:hypothetical protein
LHLAGCRRAKNRDVVEASGDVNLQFCGRVRDLAEKTGLKT